MDRQRKERALSGSDRAEQHASVGVWTRIATWCVFATVALAPLPFGSNDPAAIAVWCIVLGACLVVAPLPTLGAGQFALVIMAGVVVAAYALVLHEQLADRPWLSVAPHPLWREAAANLALPLHPSVAIARNQPWFELGRPLLAILAIAGGFVVGADRVRARQLVKVIAWSGAAYAAYGIVSHLLDPTRILWREKQAYIESVTGTFINHNTAATYFGTCAVVWSLLLWERLRLEMPSGPLRWSKMAMRLTVATPKAIVAAFAMLFLCLAAMFMTGSRAGVVLSLLALIAGFILFFRRDLPPRSGRLLALAGAAAAALVLLQLMGGGVNARFDVEGVADAARLKTYAATWRMIADHPWFGTGQGTFAYAFPAYRSADNSMWGVWDIAHNTVLEIAADMGLPVAALVVIAWIVMFVVLLRGSAIRQRDRVIPVAAAAVGLLAALHSLVDFSLQIPGYAIVALSLIGAGLAQSFVSQRSRHGVHPAALEAGDPKTSLRTLSAPAMAEDRAAATI